jgi:uncharacterized membrane protein YfcA
MPFARIIVGWLAVVLIFLAWREVEFRAAGGARGDAPEARPQRSALPPILIEAALLTLFAGLWFGSLGSGGGYLLFPLLGALIELPGRLRQRAAGVPVAWGATLAAILRVAIPGILLGFILA